MDWGTSFSADWLSDIGALREAATRLDEANIGFVSYGGHVLTSPVGRYDRPAGTYAVPFRDFFVLFANLAATTTRLRFRSGILILPMFPTVHVAKQSAELSLMSGGRFELGVGISWNEPEYRAMGQELATRGRRLEEQLIVLKQLWSQPFVSFHGTFHDIDELGLGQLPTAPIPIWIGCGEEPRSLSRVARLADGWMPIGAPSAERVKELNEAAAGAGRPDAIGVAGRVTVRADDPEAAVDAARALADAGITAISIIPPAGTEITSGIDAVISTHQLLAAEL
jgi:probable F420-dependent oxidoreductase